MKVRYFLMVQIYNLRILEVEHDLETCSRTWSTNYFNFDPTGISKAQKLKMKHQKITYFRQYVPWTKIPDNMKRFYVQVILCLINIFYFQLTQHKTTDLQRFTQIVMKIKICKTCVLNFRTIYVNLPKYVKISHFVLG